MLASAKLLLESMLPRLESLIGSSGGGEMDVWQDVSSSGYNGRDVSGGAGGDQDST